MFERQINSYTLPASLRKSMTRGFLDQRLRVDRSLIRPLLIGEMMLSQIVDHLLMFLKMQLSLKKRAQTNWYTQRVNTPSL